MSATAAPLGDALTSPAWRAVLGDVLASDAFAALDAFVRDERAAGLVLPAQHEVFAALDAVPPEAVRVVILGQDPYPTPGHAHGLAFSYRGSASLPRSLVNVFREIEEDLDVTMPRTSGDLTPWARQGVLLLNAVLTVRAGEAGSHRRRGWEAVTDAVLDHLAGAAGRRVFLLWGGEARRKARVVAGRQPVLEAGHPSPLSIRHFRGCRHFSRANEILGKHAIRWRLPA